MPLLRYFTRDKYYLSPVGRCVAYCSAGIIDIPMVAQQSDFWSEKREKRRAAAKGHKITTSKGFSIKENKKKSTLQWKPNEKRFSAIDRNFFFLNFYYLIATSFSSCFPFFFCRLFRRNFIGFFLLLFLWHSIFLLCFGKFISKRNLSRWNWWEHERKCKCIIYFDK